MTKLVLKLQKDLVSKHVKKTADFLKKLEQDVLIDVDLEKCAEACISAAFIYHSEWFSLEQK